MVRTNVLTALTVAPTAAELFALESNAQLWRVGSEPGEGLSYTKLGARQAGLVLSTSTCLDSKRGVFYYVGGANNNDCNLLGVSTADGSWVTKQKLADAEDRGSYVMWKLACDDVAGKVYALGDYDLPPPCQTCSYDDFPPPASRTIWQFDATSAKIDSLGSMPTYADQMHQASGTIRTYHGAVNTRDGQVSFIDNRRDVYSVGIYPGLALYLYDTHTGEQISIREIGKQGLGTPFVQVYDSQLNRFFGMCTGEAGTGLERLYVPMSCWWTADEEPQLMVQLSDHTEGTTTVSSVDVDARLAFFILQDKLTTVSLDTGKKVAQFETRSDRYDLYQHQSSRAVTV